jgi:hypothetical protein
MFSGLQSVTIARPMPAHQGFVLINAAVTRDELSVAGRSLH